MKSIYLSSTYEDLKQHRFVVYDALRKMRYDVRAMEDYVARDDRLVARCLDDVAVSDIYLGLFAKKYGYVPPTDNPLGKSITELEYLKARELKKSCLLFLLDGKAPWSPQFMDSETGEGHNGLDMKTLRVELLKYSYGLFTTPDDLVRNVMAAVYLCESEMRLRSLPNELRDANFLYMNSSGWPEILAKLKQATMGADPPEVLRINLGSGRAWWSTRLHLLSAICADYTVVRQFVFEGEGERFLGMCAPADVRLALAHLYRNVELAYRNSLPIPGPVFDPIQEIEVIVRKYCEEMDRLGGETSVKEWVVPQAMQAWRGVHRNSIEMSAQMISLSLLKDIVRNEWPFVALVKDGTLAQVINRTTLATSIAGVMLDQTAV